MVLRQPGKESSDVRNGIPYRRLGRTGEVVSLIGVGGYHLGRQADEQETIRIVRTAVDKGINFLDNSWDYNGGASEIRMGKALRDSFERQVVPRLVDEDIGVLGMKPMGDPFVLVSGTVTAVECLHYAMNLPTSVVITGCDSMPVLEQALHAAPSFRPLGDAAVAALLGRTSHSGRDGAYELYKTTHHFDSTYQNPEWLG